VPPRKLICPAHKRWPWGNYDNGRFLDTCRLSGGVLCFSLALGCESVPFGNERQRSVRCYGVLVPT